MCAHVARGEVAVRKIPQNSAKILQNPGSGFGSSTREKHGSTGEMHEYLHLQSEHFSQNLQNSKFSGHAGAQNSREALKSPFFAVLAENLVIFVLHVLAKHLRR